MRRRLLGAAALASVGAAAVLFAAVRPDGGTAESPSPAPPPAALAAVERGRLSSQVYEGGTLGYAARPDGSPYSVVNQATGAFTRLPLPGDVVDCGEVLYRVDYEPVVLLCGRTPALRPLSEGMTGPDVRELNRNLVALGYATRSEIDPASDEFGWETADALRELQDAFDLEETGTFDPGAAVFLPGPLRITKVTATTGTPARPGMPLAQATSTRRRIQVDLDASRAAAVEVGDRAQVTLPDNTTTPGVVSRIGTIATGGKDDADAAAKVPVYITLKRPKDVKGLDEAPVQAQITTDTIEDALSVPVTALIALAGGGYAVETVGNGGARTRVPVELGAFDHANGLVQVTGSELSAGQQVVTPTA